MKFSIAAVAAMATIVVAKPSFLNSAFVVVEGEPFTLEFDGCETGCTIDLMNGPSGDLDVYKVLTTDATGGSFTFTLDNIPSDTYAFKIVNNESDEYNYSVQFEYEGDAVTTTASATATSTSAASSSTVESTTEATTTSKATTLSKVTSTSESSAISTPAQNSTSSASSEASTTEASQTTATEDASSTAATTAATTVPDSGAARLSSSIALIAGAVMAMVYLN